MKYVKHQRKLKTSKKKAQIGCAGACNSTCYDSIRHPERSGSNLARDYEKTPVVAELRKISKNYVSRNIWLSEYCSETRGNPQEQREKTRSNFIEF